MTEHVTSDRTAAYGRLCDALARVSRDGDVVVRGNDLAAILTPTGQQRVDDAASAGLRAARTKHPGVNSSPHHGYAVLLEEVEEAADELAALQYGAADLWSAVRGDNPMRAHVAAEWVELAAVRLAVEAVQVVVTARRFRQDVPADELDGRRVA